MEQVDAAISSANQITLPQRLRKELNLKAGDKISFNFAGGDIRVTKAETHEEKVKRVFADLEKWRDGLSDETKKLIKERAGWTANQYREYIDSQPEVIAARKERYGI